MEIIPFDKRIGFIWYNGEFVEWQNATTHVLNHGLHYASCVFEGSEFMVRKSINWNNILIDYFILLKEWE